MKRCLEFARLLWTGALILALAGCSENSVPVRVASNDFTEQRLLGEMMVLLAENANVRAEHVAGYGDNRKKLEALEQGVIDAYPEYSGTILALTGTSPWQVGDDHVDAARALVEPLGLSYLEPFGLNNTFTLAVRRDFAIAFELESISDLARVPGELRFAADPGYLGRTVDGLYALARRYGLEVGPVELFSIGERKRLFRALADRTADVAEVFQTDARLADYGVVALRDDLGFFTRYEPAPLVRQSVLENHPPLRDAWNALAGRIDTETMRELNGRVERGGEDYRDVARDFLEGQGLLPESGRTQQVARTVALAIGPLTDRGYLPILAADAIRQVQPANRLAVNTVPSPAQSVSDGTARFGLVGAEEFFVLDEDGDPSVRVDIEAVGVVGSRTVHVIARRGAAPPDQWRRLGTGPEGGASWHVAGMVLRAMRMEDRVERVALDDFTAIASALDEGRVDGVALMVELRQAGLVNLLQNRDLTLVPIDAFKGNSPALRYPFLRPARIPANTYPGQETLLDTLSAQVVLATRLPANPDQLGESGPGFVPGIFTRLPQRLPFETARRLDAALDNPEAVEPLLPASPGLRPDTPELRPRIYSDPASAVLNALAIAFLAAMGVLLFKDLPQRPALQPGKPSRNGQ
ncbi:MAG: glycine betaine ABC transporter substrate-binding protein [Gammaproteobacteria bacterium]